MKASASEDIPPIVLVVEDHDDTLALYDELLSGRGYWVARAATARDALQRARELQPDVVVTDVGLSGDMNGTDLIRQLRASERLRAVPVVVVTGRNPRDLPSFADLTVSGLLLKPVAPETLLARVARALSARGSTASSSR